MRSGLHTQFTCHQSKLSQQIDLSTITRTKRELLTACAKASRLQVHVVEQRRSQRFELHLPLRVKRTSAGQVSHAALTRNMSSSGVLFASEAEVQIGGAIEYEVTIGNAEGVAVDLSCIGKVVRLEKSSREAPAYLVAATLDRYQFIRRQP